MREAVFILKVAALSFFLFYLAGLVFSPSLARSGHPTLRVIAAWHCGTYSRYATFAATNNEFNGDFSRVFEFGNPTNKFFHELVIFNQYYLGTNQLHEDETETFVRKIFFYGQDFLVKTNFKTGPSNRTIIAVCKKEFRGLVPRHFLSWNYFQRPPVFAVGYSDGTQGIITRKEFRKIDLKDFVPLSNLEANEAQTHWKIKH